jgi:hypothetical protein
MLILDAGGLATLKSQSPRPVANPRLIEQVQMRQESTAEVARPTG